MMPYSCTGLKIPWEIRDEANSVLKRLTDETVRKPENSSLEEVTFKMFKYKNILEAKRLNLIIYLDGTRSDL